MQNHDASFVATSHHRPRRDAAAPTVHPKPTRDDAACSGKSLRKKHVEEECGSTTKVDSFRFLQKPYLSCSKCLVLFVPQMSFVVCFCLFILFTCWKQIMILVVSPFTLAIIAYCSLTLCIRQPREGRTARRTARGTRAPPRGGLLFGSHMTRATGVVFSLTPHRREAFGRSFVAVSTPDAVAKGSF